MAGNAASVGAIAFDLSVNTGGLNQAINSAARSASTQLSEAFRTAVSGCEGSINSIGNSIAQMTGGLQNSFNQMSQSISETIGDSSAQLTQELNNNSSSLSEHLGNAVGHTEELGEEARNTAKSIGSTLSSAVKKLGAFIISAFAVRQVVTFSKSCVEAAAQVKALNAQIEQTFTTLQTDARNAIKAVADESGILEARLQGVGTQIYAFAKASGMDSVSALNMMQEALQVTADSAAYYDRSLEDTAESLRSFLKGNYANDAALGISCTETTRNAAANKLYGKSFMELSEAQKQLTLLQMVKDANRLSGAMGQAAREADGWENVTGNLKEAWKQFKAVIGKPLLQALIPIMKNITSAIQSLTTAAGEATTALAELFGWDLSEAENTSGAIANIAESTADSVSDAEEQAQNDIEDTVKAQKKAQGQLAGFDNLNVLSMSEEDESGSDDSKETEKNNSIAQSAELAKGSVDDLKKSVSSIKFDGIKNQIKDVISFFEPLADAVKSNVQTTLEMAESSVEKYLDKYGGKVGDYSDRIKGHFQNAAVQTKNGVTNILNEATKSQEKYSDELSSSYADLLGGASIFSLSFTDVFAGMLDTVSENFENWTITDNDVIGQFFDDINKNTVSFNETFGGILEGIGTTLTEWWDNSGSQAFDNITETFYSMGSSLLEWWHTLFQPIIDSLFENIQKLWNEHLQPLWANILDFISSIWNCISAVWDNVLKPVVDWFTEKVAPGIAMIATVIIDVVQDCVGWIIDLVKDLIKSLQGVLDFITGIFTGDFEKAMEGIDTFFEGIALGIVDTLKFAINLIIDALNALWGAIFTAVKGVIDGIGSIVEKVGELIGQDWGFSMPDEPPKIPRLAKGGLVTAPTLAVVGDNKNAKNDPEVISPLSKLQGMIDSGSACDTELLQQILMYLKMLYEFQTENGGEINITAKVDEAVLFKSMIKRNNAHKRTHGGKGAFA
ncbi:MAG: hypothetical protein K2M82_04625 [Lachnospiraceae bacterium]|nr:hypothetical protein [Lachnospiraceae bacterium]